MISMLVSCLLLGGAGSATAGPVGDAVTAFGGWIQRMESWAAEAWERYLSASSRDLYAPDLIRLLVQSPDRIEGIAQLAGFTLASYTLPLDAAHETELRFKYLRSLSIEDRRILSSKLKAWASRPDVSNATLERGILRILSDAADWRETGDRMGYIVNGVNLSVGDSVTASLDLVHRDKM